MGYSPWGPKESDAAEKVSLARTHVSDEHYSCQ